MTTVWNCSKGIAMGLVMTASVLEGATMVTVSETPDALTVHSDGVEVLVYHKAVVEPPEGMKPFYRRSGFIHPLRSPSGRILTDPFPVGHTHQHALFNAWTRVRFHGKKHDFWNQQQGTGTVEHVEVLRCWSGEGEGGFSVKLRQVSLEFGPAIEETWDVTIRPEEACTVVDFDIRQTCATDEPVVLETYRYGGFGFRGSASWNSEDDARFEGPMQVLTADGKGREEANHTRPGWIAAWGPVGEAPAGVAILDHPGNVRYPQPVRVHPKMPYFVFSPVVLGEIVLEPGKELRSRYRILTFDGEPDEELVTREHKALRE